MNKEMKKRILKVTMGLVISISLFSVIGFVIHIKENYQVINASKESKEDIRNIQEEYIDVLYNKILNEDTSKTLEENLAYYCEILNDSSKLKVKIDELYNYFKDNKIQDAKLYNYLSSVETFLVSVDKVYTLFKEGAEGDFSNLNKLSEDESSALVARVKSSFKLLQSNYEKLKLNI